MENVVTLGKWLLRGRQRSAVVRVLRKPMTASEICDAAHAFNPHVQLRDIWFLMPQVVKRGLVVCLNPRRKNGRLFALTSLGRRVVSATFGESSVPTVPRVNWADYSWVVCARIRKRTLAALARLEERTGEPQTAASVRKFMRAEYSVGLNPIIRALKELLHRGLIEPAGTTRKQNRKLYRLNESGRRILNQMRR